MESKTMANWVRGVGEYVGAAIEGTLHSNEAVNAFRAAHKNTAAVLSPVEMLSRYAYGAKGEGVVDAFAKTVLNDVSKVARDGAKEETYNWAVSNLNKRKIAGGMSGIGLGAGILGGLTHDTAGNTDIAGLPGI
jgi:hypothetical protein